MRGEGGRVGFISLYSQLGDGYRYMQGVWFTYNGCGLYTRGVWPTHQAAVRVAPLDDV